MRKTCLLLVCCMWAIFVNLSAQNVNYSQEYGKVTSYELGMTAYESDKDAEAVVLYEIGKFGFVRNEIRGRLDLRMEITTKIKILSQAGIRYGEFELPYYVSDDAEFIEIEGTTYNVEPGGIKKTTLEKKNIFEEKTSANWRVKKFAMPDVREGSVIEMKYTITTPYFLYMREWEYQKSIPVVYSKLIYRAIPYYEYTYILKGGKKFDEYKSTVLEHTHQFGRLQYKEMEYIFGMKNVPAFKDEEFISSPRDYKMSLNFQLCKVYYSSGGSSVYMSTWPEICDELLKDNNFGKYSKSAEKEAKKILASLPLDGKTKDEQVEIITQYVKRQFNWNGRSGKYTLLKVSDFLKQKTGGVAEINLFLLGMLKAAGIDAYPVAVSTRQNGAVSRDHPFAKFLNYVIVQANTEDTSFLLDATEPMLGFDQLPERCIHVNGLIVKPKSDEWLFTNQEKVALTEKSFFVRIHEEKEVLEVNSAITSHAHDAYRYRALYSGNEENLQDWLKDKDIRVTGEIETQEYENIQHPFVFSFDSEYPVERTEEKIFIPPFVNQSVTENIFKQNNRSFPVDLILFHAGAYKSTIVIPEGYKVEYIPANKEFDNPRLYINYQAKEEGDKIYVEASYHFMKNLYEANEYGILKAFYNEMVNKFNDMIVLVKEK